MLDTPAVAGSSSHVAGWVGVGGPGLGPHGEDEWLQVGLATFGDSNDGPPLLRADAAGPLARSTSSSRAESSPA